MNTSPFPHTRHMPSPSHSLDFTTRTVLRKEYRSLSSSLRNFLHSPVTSSLLGPNTLLNTLFSNTLSLRSSLNVSDQVSHPYRTFVIISRRILLRMRNVSDKICRKNQNTHFVFSGFLRKSCHLWNNGDKYSSVRQAIESNTVQALCVLND